MTAAMSVLPARTRAWPLRALQAATLMVGLAVLTARPVIAAAAGWSAPVVTGVFATVLAIALAAPVNEAGIPRRMAAAGPLVVFAAGASVFAVGRILAAGHPPAPATATLIALNTLAAVSEEALFRRVAFDALLPAGPVVAVAGSALMFGLAHVTVYGWWAFPLDVAAGLVLGWQRWACGSWVAPAFTHAIADLLVVI